MRILTWNIERVKRGKADILLALQKFDADILVLTETNTSIYPGEEYNCLATHELPLFFDGVHYKPGEKRTTIWTKYPIIGSIPTYDNYTNVCAVADTEFGNLKIYGTIIGVFGGKGERFKADLTATLSDLKEINRDDSLCFAGDFNTFLSGYAYPSYSARQALREVFKELDLDCLTADIEKNVDHIAMNRHFTENKTISIETWNRDFKLSDHVGICLTII
ncbi:endonuclease/exonuclease/phosphatase family protein [Flavobacterium akiainvivens]|uniref:endonuclease/exonuclease/phosphatase family protein n=1 Tax=Flavobacterium akiainvivens TaxID=1202724 RepID=UPI0006C85442|nr:endonuclease/exonuclease/phosphatase family protein [Flavobacterium akiainvivens]SFQ73046.1 Endonuclease/Exonuclease/phosphatase family protein [Flavobacterium akiainvivens]